MRTRTAASLGRWLRAAARRLALALALPALALAGGCATVPMTGRTQINLVSDGEMLAMSRTQYTEMMQQGKLSKDRAQVDMVRRVGQRIARAAEDYNREIGNAQTYEWEFNLVDEPQTVNAFAMPGGKVAVYTGILPVAKDEAGLAVILGHEVAHVLARHGSERVSQGLLAQAGTAALAEALKSRPQQTRDLWMAAVGAGLQYGVLLPYSRTHELEADRIGLMLSARAGYDPRVAPDLWRRMAAVGGGARPPAFLSTHPSEAQRIKQLEALVPEAMVWYQRYRSAASPFPSHPNQALAISSPFGY